MKTKLKNIMITLVGLLCFANLSPANALQPPPPVEPTEIGQNHYLKLTVPEESADLVTVTYEASDEEVEVDMAGLATGKLLIQNYSVLLLPGPLKVLEDLPFSVKKDGDDFILYMKELEGPLVYSTELSIHGDEIEQVEYDKGSAIRIHAPGGTMTLVEVPDELEEINAPPPPVDEDWKSYNMDGILKVQLSTVPSDADDGEDDADDGEGDADDQGNQDFGPEDDFEAASGGCTLLSATAGTSPSVIAGFVTLMALLGGHQFRRRVK